MCLPPLCAVPAPPIARHLRRASGFVGRYGVSSVGPDSRTSRPSIEAEFIRKKSNKTITYALTAFCASQLWLLSTLTAAVRSICVKLMNWLIAAFCAVVYAGGILRQRTCVSFSLSTVVASCCEATGHRSRILVAAEKSVNREGERRQKTRSNAQQDLC